MSRSFHGPCPFFRYGYEGLKLVFLQVFQARLDAVKKCVLGSRLNNDAGPGKIAPDRCVLSCETHYKHDAFIFD